MNEDRAAGARYPEKSMASADRARASDRSNAPPPPPPPPPAAAAASASSSEDDDSLGVSPLSGQGNQSSEREPGELSSGSVPEDSASFGLDEEKSSSIRAPSSSSSSSSSKHDAVSAEKESNLESRLNSSSPVQKKRKFTPIVWDLDEKAAEKTSAPSLPLPLPLPLPASLPLPPPPPLAMANPKLHQNPDHRASQAAANVPKKQAAERRNSPMSNVPRESPAKVSSTPPKSSSQISSTPPRSSSRMSSTPPKSSSRMSSTPPRSSSRMSSTPPKSSSEMTSPPPPPPKISSAAPALLVEKAPSFLVSKTTQISLTRTRIETSSRGASYTPSPEPSLSSSKTTEIIRVSKTRIIASGEGSYTPSPEGVAVSPFDAQNNSEISKELVQKKNVAQSPGNSQGNSPVHDKDLDTDMDPAPRINIATSRWAEESTPSRDDNAAGMVGKSKSLSTESDDAGHLSTDEEGVRDGEGSMSPEPGEYIKDKPELGESGGSNVAKDYDGHMSDEYERDLNNRELMELDKDTNDDSEEEEHPEVDSEEGEAPAVPAPPQRLIDMLQGCRSVDEYERLNKIDEGTYGVVYRARDKKTGEIVALKKVKMEKEREGFPMTSLREINVLLSIHHHSIVDVKEVVVGSNLDSIFMVMEYMEHDLKGLMESIKQPFSQSEVKCLMLQLFEGVKHLHDNWVLHRDLKTSNLLLNNRGELKICDFGLARQYGSPLKTYTHMVVTLWYRAPELLLGCKQYSTAVDMWSLGCIMAEFLAKEPLFNGKNELDQLDKIFKTLGTPNETIWPDFSKLPGVKCNFVKQPFNRLREKFPPTAFAGRPPLSESGFNLLNRLLLYDPKKRITAEEALNHEWFKEVPLPKMKELMPTYPARSEQDRRSRRLMKSPDPLLEQRKRELRLSELGSGGLFG